MIWLTMRQHRVQIIAMLALGLALAAGLAFGADYAARVRAELGVDACVPLSNTNINCVDLNIEWQKRVGVLNYLFYSLYILPGLVAAYVGGPLFAIDFERGTHRLVWTQSLSRVRWAALKIGVLGAITLVAAALLAPFGDGQHAFFYGNGPYGPFDTFEIEGPALIAYFVFGLAVGALVGAWSRRIITGMFVGLLAFGLVRVEVHQLRPNFIEPATVPFPGSTPFNRPGGIPGREAMPADAWIIGASAVDLAGRPVSNDQVNELMREYFAIPQRLPGVNDAEWLRERGVVRFWQYQPADRFWLFQWIEAGIFTALAAICVLLTFWRVRSRDA